LGMGGGIDIGKDCVRFSWLAEWRFSAGGWGLSESVLYR
jgi:hypothetical protein